MNLLSSKVSFITGASRGIGKAIAKKFAEQGSNIAFTYFSSAEKALELEKNLTSLGIKAKGYKCNAASYTETEKTVSAIIQDFGHIDILVNNAGITKDGLIIRMKEEDWDNVLSTNLKSVFNTTKAIAPLFMKQRQGTIINISSIVGIKGNAGQANYAASKAGIIGFSKSIALELGVRNIRCNVIAPGWIETDMTEDLPGKYKTEIIRYISLKRVGKAEEIAKGALFLASDMSSYITGQVIQIDGGLAS